MYLTLTTVSAVITLLTYFSMLKKKIMSIFRMVDREGEGNYVTVHITMHKFKNI